VVRGVPAVVKKSAAALVTCLATPVAPRAFVRATQAGDVVVDGETSNVRTDGLNNGIWNECGRVVRPCTGRPRTPVQTLERVPGE
jgi:hypothetical protein